MLKVSERLSVCMMLLAVLVAPSVSNAQDATLCDLTKEGMPRSVLLDKSWQGVSYDGGDGVDTFTVSGPSYFSPRPDRIRSIEVFQLENGLFDTIIVNAEMILGTERGEIEIISDWFDQVILEPGLDWSRSVDAAFSSQILTAVISDRTVTVRTGLNTSILTPTGMPLETREGPLGVFDPDTRSTVVLNARPSESEGSDAILKLRARKRDIVRLNLRKLNEEIRRIVLDTKEGFSNSTIVDINEIDLSYDREIIFDSDELDRLVLVQPECWDISKTAEKGKKKARYKSEKGTELTLTAASHHFDPRRTGPYVIGSVHEPGYRHLSADGQHIYDQFDFRNGGPDTFILRNSMHLRNGIPLVIRGDVGQDHIWLEGTAGWRLEYWDNGVVARVPFGGDKDIILAFMPGLKVSVLSTPHFLNDPAMLDLPAYPGIANDVGDYTGLVVTRAGFVKFSQNQLENVENLDLRNGIANTLQITPDQLSLSADGLHLKGDKGLDTLLAKGFSEPESNGKGQYIWRLTRSDGTEQVVTAEGFSYLTQPSVQN